MREDTEIELSSIEATSYWWINLIKQKVREIITEGSQNKKEATFAQIFYYYTEVEWRNLYLELTKYIAEDVNNYVPTGNIIEIDAFSQDTDIKGHNIINKELSKITKHKIPDIRLAGSNIKDFVIYTNASIVSVWYKSCGIIDLPTKYEPTYILTGDKQKLNFYNLLLATIATIQEIDERFTSVSLLRENFCKEYIKLNNIEDNTSKITEMFNKSFEIASDKGIILGRYYRETYYCSFQEIDFIGLEEYMEEAKYYANVILEESKISVKKTCNNRTRKPNQT